MMKNKNRFFILLFVMGSIYFFHAKSKAGILQFAENPESIYLHVSEEVVMAGQWLWFQTYLTSESQANASKVVYVELQNSSGQQIMGSKLIVASGTAKGEFLLPDSLSTGWYQVNAYTQWMLNFPESEVFRQQVLVINPNQKEIEKNLNPDSGKPVYFYPEGGNFVEGVDNHIVFRINPNLVPETLQSADIVDESDSLVATVQLSGKELGAFYLTPKAGKNHSIRCVISAYDTLSVTLPLADTQGYTLQVRQKDSKFQATVQRHLHKQEELTLRLQSNGKILFSQTLPTGDSTWAVAMKTDLLSGNYGNIILVNQQGDVLAERVVYAEPEKEVQIQLNTSSAKLLPREKVQLQIKFSNGQSETSVKNASLSVRKVNPFYDPMSAHQFPVLAEPPALLSNKDKKLLNWWLIMQKDVTSSRQVLVSEEEKNRYPLENEGLLLSGILTDQQGNPLKGRTLLLSIPGTDPQFDYFQTDQQGRFFFPLTRVFGQKEVILQVPREAGYTIMLDEKFSKPAAVVFPGQALPFIKQEDLLHWIEAGRKRRDISQIYNLYKMDSTDSIQENKGDTFRFYGAPNFVKDLDDYIALPTFEEVCRELMPGVQLKGEAGAYHLEVFDVRTREFLNGEPTLLIDGVPVFDVERLVNMPPDAIARIETVNRRTYYGEFPFNGTAAIYSGSGKEYENFLSPDVFRQAVTFLEKPVSFSKIFPEAEKPASSRIPDFRTLLYWQPDVKPNEQGEAIAAFYSSDETGTFEAVVSGVTPDGQPFSQAITFEVSSPVQE